MLAAAINEACVTNGIAASVSRWKGLEALRQPGVHLVIVKYSMMLDHWVVVLEFSGNEVLVADPLTGLGRESHADFLRRWRGYGVTVGRTQ